MRNHFIGVLAVLSLAVLIAPSTARGDTITPIFFDGFEADTGNILNASLVNWNIVSGSVDVLSGGNLCGSAGSNSNCVDLDGSGLLAGTIETKTTFALDPGTYRLSFELAGANRQWTGSTNNTVVVSLGSYFSQAITPLQWDPFETYSYDINLVNPGGAKIGFSHSGNDWIGLLLDNVSLAKVTFDQPEVIPTPTPESGGWELTLAVIGLAAFGFRKTLVGAVSRG
ncbi:MAG: hypothetical protein WD733_21460 [Bryobacterales bacterium]